MFKRLASASVLGCVFLACTDREGAPSDAPLPTSSSGPAPAGAAPPSAPPLPAPTPRVASGRVGSTVNATGAPNFIWANRGLEQPPVAGASLEATARAQLRRFASFYGVDPEQAATLELRDLHDTGRGARIARFARRVQGIEVFGEQVSVALDRGLEPVAVTGRLGSGQPSDAKATPATPAGGFALDATHALLASLADLTQVVFAPSELDAPVEAEGDYQTIGFARARARLGANGDEPARVKRVYYPDPNHPARLLPAYYVEVNLGRGPDRAQRAFASVISAADGAKLWKRSLAAREKFSYRVYADESGLCMPWDGPEGTSATPSASALPDHYQAPFATANLVTLSSLESVGVTDPWLPPGASSTLGNNADVYLDFALPDGFTPGADFRAAVSAPGVFDYTADPSADADASEVQRQAAMTQVFYNLNWFHDWYYAAGFTESAGNGQFTNYGRGGIEGDPIRAEAQDGADQDNADMYTPADGAKPVMQMYLWIYGMPTLTVSAPESLAGSYETGTAIYAPRKFDLSGAIVRATPPEACAPLDGDVQDKIVFVDDGTCSITDKVLAAQHAGAAGVIIANVESSHDADLAPQPFDAPAEPVTIAVATLNRVDGDRLRAGLASGEEEVQAQLTRDARLRDGGLDNQVIAHEWGHYISNRLIHNAAGLGTNISDGLGEGWADTHALLITVRPEDIEVPSNASWNGVYAMGGYATGSLTSSPYYFGVRRYPYSTDLAKDPLTFRHISNEAPLPDGIPRAYTGDNTEVHAIGEVWATMLWECYAALLRDTLGASPRLSFAEARDRMRDYLVAAYKLTPSNPTLLEARDALLAAALASDASDYQRFVAAFAKRGAGVNAVGPSRFDETNSGIIESYAVGAAIVAESMTLSDDVQPVCNPDGILDNGETGTLRVAFENTGDAATDTLTATVTSNTPGVTFPDGNTISIPALAVQGTSVGTLRVQAEGLAGLTPLDLAVQLPDAGAGAPAPAHELFLTNADEIPAQSLSDGAETSHVVWQVASSSAAIPEQQRWQRLELSPTSHVYHCSSSTQRGAVDFVSPPLRVLAGTPFTLSFKHRFDFEAYDPETTYDGGVIEISADGTNWYDVGQAIANYPGAIVDFSDNPLGGRPAFVGKSPSYPDYDAAQLDFGDSLAGQQIQLRFRVASDNNTAFHGWDIDDLAFTGLAVAPFYATVPQPERCDNTPLAAVGNTQFVNEFGAEPDFPRTVVTLDGSESFDPDGDPLSYHWLQIGGPPVQLKDADKPLASFPVPDVPAGSQTGLSFQLQVSDGSHSGTSEPSYVLVTDVNRPPTANAGAAQNVDEGALVRLDGSASSDPDADGLSYLWTAPAGIVLSNLGTVRPAFVAPKVDGDTDLVIELAVSDGVQTSATSQVVLRVHDLDPPLPVAVRSAASDAGPAEPPSPETPVATDAGAAP